MWSCVCFSESWAEQSRDDDDDDDDGDGDADADADDDDDDDPRQDVEWFYDHIGHL